jgi:hypothetical protein
MADPYPSVFDSLVAPARQMFLITPHATNEVDPVPKAIRADGAGTIAFRAIGSTADVTVNVVAGEVIVVRPLYVRATGTTVSVIHGLL